LIEKINESVYNYLRQTQEDDEISQTRTMLQSYISITVPSYQSSLDALIAGVQNIPEESQTSATAGEDSDFQQTVHKIKGTDLLNTLE
jgi:hypothetical protein